MTKQFDAERPLSGDEAEVLELYLRMLMRPKPMTRDERLAITSALYVAAVQSGERAPNERTAQLLNLSGPADPHRVAEIT